MRELKDTYALMVSKDYKDRFLAEYYQACIRAKKLRKLLDDHRKNLLSFKPVSSIVILEHQLYVMDEYIVTLKIRANAEGIELEEV